MEKSLLSNLKAMLFKYKRRFLKGLLFVVLSNALLLLNPILFRQALYSMGGADEKKFLWGIFLKFKLFENGNVWVWAILLLLIAFLSTSFKYWMRIAFITISREAEAEMRERIFLRMQNQSQEFFDRHGIGEILSRLTNDITQYRSVIGPGAMYPFFRIYPHHPGDYAAILPFMAACYIILTANFCYSCSLLFRS